MDRLQNRLKNRIRMGAEYGQVAAKRIEGEDDRMKNGRYRRFVTGIILALLTIFMACQPVYANDVIRVGFFGFDGYHNMDANGYRSGYGYEFIQKMLRYNNYTAEYVGYDKNWAAMQEMLEKGEIDILTSAQKTPEREAKFDFSEQIGTSAAILTVKEGDERFSAGEYGTYNGMRVGVIEGNSRNDRFVEFAAEKHFTYTLVYYSDMKALTKDLQAGENIDAIVTSNLRQLNEEWILDKFAVSPFYAMVRKGNFGLLRTVNYAIDQMNSNSVGWQDELFNKYYAGNNGGTIALSSTERDYLQKLKKDHKKIRVVVNPDREPYSYVEGDDIKGIIPEIFEETARRLDLPYEYVMCRTREEYQELVKSGEIDVVLDGRNDLSAAENSGYKLTDSYMELAYSVLERSEFSGEVKSVAILALSDTSKENLAAFTEGREVLECSNMRECVDAVLKKQVDACYLYNYSAQKYAIENIRGNLQSTTLPDLSDSLSFGIYATDDYRLLAILNKGAMSVRGNCVDTAIKNHTDFSIGDLTLLQLMYRNPIIPVSMVTMLAVMLLLFVYGYQKKRSEVAQQQKNKELERFIGYVCKANSSVMEVNFQSGKSREFLLKDGHVQYESSVYAYNDAVTRQHIPEEDYKNITDVVNAENIGEIIDRGEDRYFEYRALHDGVYRWYAVTMAAIPKDEAHPKNVIIFKRDIDELKRKEEETRQSLKDALEAANQASKSKGNFLSNMSHEIRTPLNAIIGYLTLARDEDVSREKLLHCLDNCDVASKHLLQIINDILDMSSIESGKLKIAHDEFNLKKEITDITTIFFQTAKNKGVEFETMVDNLTQEWVIGDQLRLNQVLMNLLSNAVKFTPEHGTVQLLIRQMNEDAEKVYVQFTVTDTGIGMSEEYMSRIFRPFEQEYAGTAKKFGGSGLGLSITNNLIHMMGGTITVKSRQNEGTAFTVTMYFEKTEKKHEAIRIPADYSRVRALIVDDKEEEGTYIKTMLKRCGVKSDSVTSGEAALKRIRSRMGGDYSYDLCIIDWVMPEMDGGEVTRRIREQFGEKLPIIIATAYDITEFEDEAKAAGADRIIAKPLFQSTLFDLLVSVFGKYDPEAAGSGQQEKLDMSNVRLLLAEDNPMNMEIAVTMLEKAGITVDQAFNGQEAYDRFTAAPAGTYNMILMDVQMPVLDGYEATRKIRNSDHPDAKTIPIIAMTANAFAEDVAEALANGMNAHIAKPINYDKLFALLKKY